MLLVNYIAIHFRILKLETPGLIERSSTPIVGSFNYVHERLNDTIALVSKRYH
jgi:hypothetical protein